LYIHSRLFIYILYTGKAPKIVPEDVPQEGEEFLPDVDEDNYMIIEENHQHSSDDADVSSEEEGDVEDTVLRPRRQSDPAAGSSDDNHPPAVKKSKATATSSSAAAIAPAAKHQRKKAKFRLEDKLSSLSESSDFDSDAEEHEHHLLKTPKRSHLDQFMQKKGNEFCSKCYSGHSVPHFDFEISSDGVQLHKRAGINSAAWPVMGTLLFVSPCIHLKDKVRFYMPRNSKPIIIGFYYGSKKPEANELLRCLFKEMHVAHKRRLCTSFLRYYIGDGPSRQMAKGFPSSQSYSGCERLVTHFNLYHLHIPTYNV